MDVHYGWLIRYLHAIGATGIFFALYVHMGNLWSCKGPRELLWWIGLLIFLGFMAEAFMGHLPWADVLLGRYSHNQPLYGHTVRGAGHGLARRFCRGTPP
ncbi:MAG: hypothetical protein HS130_12875 [Deltaproteobacteria bacterium]|nr:hypothetical protein [Deltaproteobacteria bacterium]